MTGKKQPSIGLALLLILSFSILPVTAQGPGPVVVIDQVNDQDFPRVIVRVTALDSTGLPLENLTAADFQVWEDGLAATITGVSIVPPDQVEPLSLVLALDVSGSMQDNDANGVPKLDAARSSAKSLLTSLGPNDQAALISFSEAIVVEQPFTTDKAALQAALDRLQLDGDTALYNALFDAADLAASLPPGKKAIILLTDGENTFGEITLEDALDRAIASGAPVYTVGFFTGDLPPERRVAAEEVLTRIARVTNGRYFAAPTAEELSVAFQQLALLLRLQYEISFDSGLVADCKPHELKVRVSHLGQDGDDVDVFAATTSPVATLVEPVAGATLGGIVSLVPQVAPPAAIASVEFQVDGTTLTTIDASPFSFDWDSAAVDPGPHTIMAIITDSCGTPHTLEAAVTVVPPMTLEMLEPEDGQEVSGELRIEAEAMAVAGVERVEFLWNGELLGEVTSPPYVFATDCKQYVRGDYTLLARAYDTQGHDTHAEVTVTCKPAAVNAGLGIALAAVVLALGLIIPFAIRARRRRTPVAPAPDIGEPAYAPPPAAGRLAWLEVIQGSTPGQRFALSGPEITLGRSRAENDIHVEGRTASRRQAVIKATGSQYVLYDISPTNPTIINGQEIAGSQELYEGDQVEIGDMILRFTFEEGKA